MESEKNSMYPYLDISYDTKKRFCSYWHQIDEIVSLKPTRVLEIGVGNGFVKNYLRNKAIHVIGFDIAFALKPDVNGSILNIPFADGAFDVVSCCEVLEHLPYSDFQAGLAEIHRVSSKYVVLSLPDTTTVYRIYLELPRINNPIKKLIHHPFHRAALHVFDGEHFWEIGKKGYSLKKIEKEIRRTGFEINYSYRVFEWPYHRFFLLGKKRT